MRAEHGRWLPYLLLALACALVFLLQNFKVAFETSHHGYLSSHGAALAKNLSFRDRLLLFHTAVITEDGKVSYQAYSRFPIFPFAIIKVAMLPFEPDLARQVYAARQTMNLFLVLAMIFAFLAVREWTGEPYRALGAVLLTFSSYYVLYYADMIFNDVPALFGVTLVAWAAIKSRISGLSRTAVIIAAVVAISMGWQPYGVLGAWLLTDLALFVTKPEGTLSQFVRRPAILALGAAIVWGSLVVGLQLANEASAMGRTVGELDTVDAIRFRLGMAPAGEYAPYAGTLEWPEFLLRQAERIVFVVAPVPLARRVIADDAWLPVAQVVVLLLLVGAMLRIATSRSVSWKPFAAVLVASGFVWAIPMKHFVAFHDFQTIFYLGLPIVAFTGLLLCVPRRLTMVAALLAFAVFAASLSDMNGRKQRLASIINPVTDDFAKIYRKLPKGSKVFVDGDKYALGGSFHALDFYLSGSYFAPLDRADYVISTNRYSEITGSDDRLYLLVPRPRP